jgi:hypothetical protein
MAAGLASVGASIAVNAAAVGVAAVVVGAWAAALPELPPQAVNSEATLKPPARGTTGAPVNSWSAGLRERVEMGVMVSSFAIGEWLVMNPPERFACRWREYHVH